MPHQAEKPTPEALLGGSDDPAAEADEQRSRDLLLRAAIRGVAVSARAFRAAAEPPPRPGLPDADLLAGMVPESMAALREREWRSGASLIPRWYKLLLVGVGTMGAAWGVTGSPQQALAVACAGSCLALVASESYRRLRQLKLTPMNPRAPA
jgi:hypothetical protein